MTTETTTEVYRGVARQSRGAALDAAGRPVADFNAVIWATRSLDVARHYGYGFRRPAADQGVLRFAILDPAAIVDLRDEAAAAALADEIAAIGWDGEDLAEDEHRAAFVAELVAGEAGGHLAYADDPGFVEAVANLGWRAITDGETLVILDPDLCGVAEWVD